MIKRSFLLSSLALLTMACGSDETAPANQPTGPGAGTAGSTTTGGVGAGGAATAGSGNGGATTGAGTGGVATGGGGATGTGGTEPVVFDTTCVNEPTMPGQPYVYKVPRRIDDGLPTGDIAQSGIDLNRLTMPDPVSGDDGILVRLANNDLQEFHSILIVKDGKLVLEEYYTGNSTYFGEDRTWVEPGNIQHTCETQHYVASITKSVSALLAGIVFGDKGLTPETAVATYVPEYADLISGGKENITFKNLMTMQVGVQWEEWAAPPTDLENMFASDDYLTYMYNKPMLGNPLEYHYNNAGPNVMAVALDNILEDAACTPNCLPQFAKARLFDKLQISDYSWYNQPNGEARRAHDTVQGGIGLMLSSRALAKIGMLVLQGGMFNGEQVVPADFITAMTTKQSTSPDGRGYGYWWWFRDAVLVYPTQSVFMTYFAAEGDGGSYIEVIPDLNMVVVFTGGSYSNYGVYEPQSLEVLKDHVVPAAHPDLP